MWSGYNTGRGLDMGLGYEQVEPSGLAVLEKLLVESNSECG